MLTIAKYKFSLAIYCLALFINPASAKPNIIFIMADDLGYSDLGCYGQKHILTPHLDQMANEGMRFSDFYSGAPVCAPARSVLMTGQHTGHTTVRGNKGKGGVKGLGGSNGRVPLKAEDITIAEILKSAGYTTGMTGKWGLGEPNTSGEPNSQGFDEWFGYLNQRRAHDYYPEFLWHNRKKVELPGNINGKQEQYSHDLCTDFALNFIKQNAKQPFFLYIPFCIPHDKYQIPDMAPYADKPWKEAEKVHAAMITRMDRDIGRLFKLLKQEGIDNNTIVFFCSDNGAARRWDGRFNSSGPLRGQKRSMTDGGIRTPMIARWPGKIQAGSQSKLAAYFPDILPTLAAIADTKAPESIDGINILPTLKGEDHNIPKRFLYWEFFEGGFKQAVRMGNWKAIRAKPNQDLKLYDLSKDISEANNIAKDHPKVIAEIETYLKTARTESAHWPTPQTPK